MWDKYFIIDIIAAFTLGAFTYFEPYIFSSSTFSIVYVIAILGALLATFMFLKKKLNETLTFFLMFFYAFGYVAVTRLIVLLCSTASPKELGLLLGSTSPKDLSANFAIGYGLMQFFTGAVINNFGYMGSAVAAIALGGTGLAFGMGFATGITSTVAILLMGASASMAFVALMCYLSEKFDSQLFASLSNIISFYAMSLGNGLAEVFTNSQGISKTIKAVSILTLSSGVGLALFAPSGNTQVTTEEDTSLWDLAKRLFGNTETLFLTLYGWFANCLGYALMRLDTLNPLNITGSVLGGSALGSVVLPLMQRLIGFHYSLVLLSTLQVIAVVVVIVKLPTLGSGAIAQLCGFIIGIGSSSHNLPQMLVGERYTGKFVPFTLGMMNFFAMFFGVSLTLKILPLFNLSMITTLKVLAVPSIIAANTAIFLAFRKYSKNS